MLSTKGQYKHLEPKSGESERFPALWSWWVPARGKRWLTSRVATILLPASQLNCTSSCMRSPPVHCIAHCNMTHMDFRTWNARIAL